VKPEIESYLREHGDRYTTEALREQLITAGHGPDEVDAALVEWRSERSAAEPSEEERRRFKRLTWLIHGVVLAAAFVWFMIVSGGDSNSALLVSAVLAIALWIGVGISSVIGRMLLRGPGLSAALVVPVVTALLIGGSCFGLTGGFSQVMP
jgi:hypothetical protein